LVTWKEHSDGPHPETDDMDPVIRHFKIAKLTGHPAKSGWLNNLGSMLSGLYKWTNKTEDLEEAINNARRVVDTTPQDHPDLAAGFLSIIVWNKIIHME